MSGSDDQDVFEDEGPRSIFAATWFRVVLVLIVFAVIGAVAVPYILDYMNPAPKPTMASRPPLPVARPNAAAPPAPAPPPAPAVSTPVPTQPAPQPAQRAPQTAMPAPTPPAAVAQAQPRSDSPPASSKPSLSTKKIEAKEEAKPAPKVAATKSAEAKASAETQAPVARQTVAKTAPAAARGSYWVQVGAFRDEGTAKRVAGKVGGPNVVVTSTRGGESAAPPAVAAPAEPREPAGTADLYDVFVSGGAPTDISRRLAGKGLAADPTAGGVVVRPSQPLRDAVALSKDLAVDGFKVQVRRATGGAPRPAASRPVASAAPAPPASASGETLYRVRVGPYADRAAATAALRDLDAKGYKGFIARGEQ